MAITQNGASQFDTYTSPTSIGAQQFELVQSVARDFLLSGQLPNLVDVFSGLGAIINKLKAQRSPLLQQYC